MRRALASSVDVTLTVKPVAVATAFRKYSRYVAATAYRMLQNREDVEDVVQEVFLDAVIGLDRLRNEAAVQAWLTVVTIRNATARRRLLAASLAYEFNEDLTSETQLIDGGHEWHLELSAVVATIQALPDEQRLPWVLHCLEGLTLPAVARACGCSVATVKRRIALARTRIARTEPGFVARS